MTAMDILEQADIQFRQGEKLDVQLMDQVIAIMNQGSGDEQRKANHLLMRLKDDQTAWTKVDAILQFSERVESKYFALQVLENVIQTRWKSLPTEQREGVRAFIVQHILELSSKPQKSAEEKVFLHKLNLVLVQMVKQDWPKNWPTFITDIVSSSHSDPNICTNNMNILALLSEEVFDFGSQNLTQAKEVHLKKEFCGQFQQVFELCLVILEQCPSDDMVAATLKTLHRFLTWIPIGYVFETKITQLLTENFLGLEAYRVITLKCLTEVAQVPIQQEKNEEYKQRLRDIYFTTIKEIGGLLNNDSQPDLAAAYVRGSDADQQFIMCLAEFLVVFLKEHSSLVEIIDGSVSERLYVELHMYAMQLLISLSRVEEIEVFKICLDFWGNLCSDLYRESPFTSHGLNIIMGGQPVNKRRDLYKDVLSELRVLMISRMAKPEEVLVVENDQGEVVREMVKDTDAITLYKNMRETLVYLTHLDKSDTEQKMLTKLENQVNGSEFSWKNLNSLCWAIGSISGTMSEDEEKRFLVGVIRDLLGMVEQRRGKDNKAVIASNIMYVVGQYPRFLRAHWKFLKTVINKLFEFMHESHDGVQDMACDTFIKIAIKTKRHFVIMQSGELRPFIDEIIEKLPATICDLTNSQVHVFFEAVGHIISAALEDDQKNMLIVNSMQYPQMKWDHLMALANENLENFLTTSNLQDLVHVLKINVALCKSVGMDYVVQLSRIYGDLLSIYRILSAQLSDAIVNRGEEVVREPIMKLMRSVKRESLILLSTWVASNSDRQLVIENIVPPLFEAVLADYCSNVPAAREPKVLSLLSIIATHLAEDIAPQVPSILSAVFECTLEMINKDMEAWPEHRTNFFLLLLSLVECAFSVFVAMPPEQFQIVLDAVVWAFQHSMRNVAENGLDILKSMLLQLNDVSEELAQPFYKRYYMVILHHVLAVVADRNQVNVAGLQYYAEILCVLFRAPEYGIKVPLNDANPEQSNIDFIFVTIGELFTQHFPHLAQDQIRVIVKGFFSYNLDVSAMRNHLRDFLVQLKEFVGEDTSDLFLEEREKEIQEAQARKALVPGMLNPHDIVDSEM